MLIFELFQQVEMSILIYNIYFTGSTCCELLDGKYGCCPLENAVCCDDHIHCCPQTAKCEVGMCLQADGGRFAAKSVINKENDIRCFGSQFVCPDRTTCCEGPVLGTYGCCPIEHAVCCSDGVHCCPAGLACDVHTGQCVGKGFVSQMYDSRKNESQTLGFAKFLPLVKSGNVKNVICPGASFQCPNGYTCCQLPSGQWGCCPFAKATCCSDHLHCCPENMRCDVTSKNCLQGNSSVPSLLKESSKPINLGLTLTCPDNTTCADFSTCCIIGEEQYGCCPYQDAMCCEDLTHCCPSGYKCDIAEKQCMPNQKWVYNLV